jgi:DNA-binding LytR/AlgR family response regulator
MTKIAICDDDENFTLELGHTVKEIFETNLQSYEISIFNDGTALLFSEIEFDVLFLDIDMPNISGIEIANILRKNNTQIILIFVTWYEDMVYTSLKYKPFRFLRKKFIKEEINEVINDLIEELNEINEFYSIKTNAALSQIKIRDIMYFEVYDHQILIHIRNSDVLEANLALSKIEKRLNNKGFIRIHNSYLVNYVYIFSIEKSEIILDGKIKLPLSKHRVNEVKHKLQYFERHI